MQSIVSLQLCSSVRVRAAKYCCLKLLFPFVVLLLLLSGSYCLCVLPLCSTMTVFSREVLMLFIRVPTSCPLYPYCIHFPVDGRCTLDTTYCTHSGSTIAECGMRSMRHRWQLFEIEWQGRTEPAPRRRRFVFAAAHLGMGAGGPDRHRVPCSVRCTVQPGTVIAAVRGRFHCGRRSWSG